MNSNRQPRSMLSLLRDVFLGSLPPILLLLMTSGAALWNASMVPMLEAGICRDWYIHRDPGQIEADGWVPQHLCKILPIQKEVAFIHGGQIQFDALFSLVLAFPYAWLEKRADKRNLLILGCCGSIMQYTFTYFVYRRALNLPMWSSWFGSVFQSVGGGVIMATTYLWSMLATAVPEQVRASVFFATSSSLIAISFLATSLSAYLLQSSPWTSAPVGLSAIAAIVLILLINLLHEKLGFMNGCIALSPDQESCFGESTDESTAEAESQDGDAGRSSQELLINRHDIVQSLEPPPVGLSSVIENDATLWGFFKHMYHQYLTKSIFLTYILMLMCLVFAYENAMILQQWVSATFSWPYSAATLLNAYIMLMSFVVLATLPYFSTQLRKHVSRSTSFDLFLVQINFVLSAVGSFAMGLAPTPELFVVAVTFYVLGCGSLESERAFAATLVPAASVTELFTLRMMVVSLTDMISGYVWAVVFQVQASLGGFWHGLPFLIAGLSYLLCLILGWKLKRMLRRKDASIDVDVDVR